MSRPRKILATKVPPGLRTAVTIVIAYNEEKQPVSRAERRQASTEFYSLGCFYLELLLSLLQAR